jgi:hypothetical protein
MMGIVGIEGVERWINWWLCGYIAFLIHKRYIPNPEKLNQQRFKCAAQMREPLYILGYLRNSRYPRFQVLYILLLTIRKKT